jgi:O-antigen ligase
LTGHALARHAFSPLRLHLLWLALAALAGGLLVAVLPPDYSLALLAGVALLLVAVWEPALGLGLALALGPAKAFLAVVRPELPDPGQVFFALAVAGWLARCLIFRKFVLPWTWLLLPLSAYIFVGLFSLLMARSLEEGLKEVIKWAQVAVTLVITVAELRRGRLSWVITMILLAGAVQGAIGLWQYALRGTGPEHFALPGGFYRAYGSFEQPNPYGGYLGLIWPVAAGLALQRLAQQGENARMKWKRHWLSAFILQSIPILAFLGVAILCLAGLYASFSRGAWIGAAAASLVLVLFWPRRLSVGVGLVTGMLVSGWALAQAGLLPAQLTARLADVADFTTVVDVRGVNINDANFAIVERLAHWQAAAEMARAHPWLGVGIGNYAAAYPEYSLLNWPNALGHAHMVYLNVIAETGLLGLVTYVTLWGIIILVTIRGVSLTSGSQRGLALGLLAAWAHLSAHHLVDNLYVNNIHFLIAALLGVMVHVIEHRRDNARG